MRLLLAILLPPFAVATTGRPRDLALNLLLTLMFWLPGSVHAIMVVARYYDAKDPLLLPRAIRSGA